MKKLLCGLHYIRQRARLRLPTSPGTLGAAPAQEVASQMRPAFDQEPTTRSVNGRDKRAPDGRHCTVGGWLMRVLFGTQTPIS